MRELVSKIEGGCMFAHCNMGQTERDGLSKQVLGRFLLGWI